MTFDIVEKAANWRVHASFSSRDEAERYLREDFFRYAERNIYCVSKGLSVDDFEIIECET
jgi:hypothetical protein